MTSVTFDYIKKLEQAGIPPEQARAQVEVFTAITEATSKEAVAKQEFERLEKDIRNDIERSESRLELKIDKLDFKVSGLEKKMDGFDKRMDNFEGRINTLGITFKWGLGTGLTYLTLLMALFQFLK